MLRKVILMLAIVLPFVSKAQGPQDEVQLSVSASGASKEWSLVYKPLNYTTSKRYPLIVFFHGAGESGSTQADLAKIYNSTTAGGPAYFIAHGQWPDSFYNYMDGKYYQFIVISPQAGGGWSTDYKAVPYLLSDIVSKYAVDTSRIYLTGLSAGGWTLWNYSAHYQVTPNYKAAAIVPMSAATTETSTDCQFVAADSIRDWGFGDVSGDIHGLHTKQGVDILNSIAPGIARFTDTHPQGHGGWNIQYVPTYREVVNTHNVNIYEWMLWWDRDTSSGQPSNQPPTVDAGPNRNLSSGTTTTSITAAANDIDGSIVSYQWSKISGGSVSLSGTTTPTLSVSGMSDNNSYTFRIIVTDNGGLTAFDDITVNVVPDLPPTVNAGIDQSITLPTDSVQLSGAASDDHGISSTSWSIVSKPMGATPSIKNLSSLSTIVNDMDSAGVYTFRLSATDNNSQTSTDDININVIKNQEGAIQAKFQFGPYGATKQGGYAYVLGNPSGKVLSATQNGITVNTLATNQWYGLGGDTSRGAKSAGKVTGNNSGIVPDNVLKYYILNDGAYWGKNLNGIVQSYNMQISGLTAYGFYNVSMGASVDQDQVGSYELGDVEYRIGTLTQLLDITNNTSLQTTFYNIQADGNGSLFLSIRPLQGGGADNKSSMGHIGWLEVDGTGESNLPPIANAGKDTTYANGTTSAFLDGTSSYDPEGEALSYHWYKQSGDTGTITIVNPTSPSPAINGMNDDTVYTFKLVVMDTGGSLDSDYVSITVGNPAVGNPIVNAGYPQLLADGSTIASLSGEVTVAGGEVSSIEWKQVYGDLVSISDPTSLSTPVTGLSAGGIYRFRLVATNNVGVSDSDEVVVAVNKYYAGKKDSIITTTLTNYHLVNIDFDQTPYNVDTISILGGEYSYIYFKNMKGSSTKRILIRPLGGPVQMTSHVTGGTAGMLFTNCQYFHVDGTLPDSIYGFNLIGAERWGQINIGGQSKCFEINNIYGRFMTYGFQIKNDPTCDPISWNTDEASTFVMDSIELHHFYFDSTIYEGTYIGGTLNTGNWSYPPNGGYRSVCSGDTSYHYGYRVGHISIHDGTIKNTTNDGVQLVDSRFGFTEIYNMHLEDIGGTGGGQQDHAMSLGGNNQAYIHDNYINGAGFGYFLNGLGSVTFARDTMINCNSNGWYIASSLDSPYHKIMTDSMVVRMYDNYIDSVDGGIVLTNYQGLFASTSQFYNNSISNYGQGDFIYAPGTYPTHWEGDYGGSSIDTSNGIRPWIIINGVDTSGNTLTIHSVSNTTLPKQFSLDGNTWQSDSVFTNLQIGVYMAHARIDPAIMDLWNRIYIASGEHVNVPPVALAGTNIMLPFKTTTTNLLGQGSDPDGTIVSWLWKQVEGSATISSPNTQNTPVTGLKSDSTYQFSLTVTDDGGLTGTDTVTVSIEGNTPPVVNAGIDQILPALSDNVQLQGTASDINGSIASYHWTQISGPTASISTPNAAATQVTALQSGASYIFRLTATDGDGGQSFDDVNVTIQAIPSGLTPKAVLYLLKNGKLVIINAGDE